MSQNTRVNYVHYGRTTDSSSIEVNQLQQIKGEGRSHRPLLSQSCCTQCKENPSTLWLSKARYNMDGKGHVTNVYILES